MVMVAVVAAVIMMIIIMLQYKSPAAKLENS
jgi:hypothetical protein